MTPVDKAQSVSNEVRLSDIIQKSVQLNASDIHITAGAKPSLRVDGRIVQLTEYPVLTPDMTQKIAYSVMS
ncbi:MAG: type IV pili twitching motility protein PilT, partial [Aquificaceae bacterium]|nr:type IV pili twitching motility protein PilT [Aquificaceae bacterium]